MTFERTIDRRIFVVGVPRSGTTLVQSLLAAHSTTTSFTESHFFSRHFALVPPLAWPILTRSPRSRIKAFLAENDEPPPAAAAWFDDTVRGRALLPFRTRGTARQLLRVLDEITLRRGKTRWVEKTPKHLHYVSFLGELTTRVPETHFVHVIRDGVDVVASLHHASANWERPYDIPTCVSRWNRDVSLSRNRIDHASDHFVFYEELNAEPERTLKELFGALGLAWEASVLEAFGGTSERLVTPEETWKSDVGRAIRRSESLLSPDVREYVRASLKTELYDEVRRGRASGALMEGSA